MTNINLLLIKQNSAEYERNALQVKLFSPP